jgi:hypothetical protein
VRAVYRIWATVVFAMVIIQVGLAGWGAFYVASKVDDGTVDEDQFFSAHGFGLHSIFGYLVVLAGLVLLIIGVVAGIGKWRLGRHGVLALLLILQVFLAFLAFGVPATGFLHPVNALAIFSLAGWIASDEWRRTRGSVSPVAV